MKALLLLLALFAAPDASAHLVSTRFGELYSGMLHPITTLQHLVPWLALGLLGGLQPIESSRLGLLVFPVAVLLGLGLQSVLPALPFVAAINLAGFVVLGLLIAFRIPLPGNTFAWLAVLVGLTHGYANASPDLTGYGSLLYALGVGIVAYMTLALVTGPAQALSERDGWGPVAIRAAGSWIAAAGMMYAGFLLLLA